MSSLQIRSKFSQLGEPCAPGALSWSSRSPCTIPHVPSAVILTLVEWLLCLEKSPMMLWTAAVLLTEATTQMASETSRIYHRSHCHTPVCESAQSQLPVGLVLCVVFSICRGTCQRYPETNKQANEIPVDLGFTEFVFL